MTNTETAMTATCTCFSLWEDQLSTYIQETVPSVLSRMFSEGEAPTLFRMAPCALFAVSREPFGFASFMASSLFLKINCIVFYFVCFFTIRHYIIKLSTLCAHHNINRLPVVTTIRTRDVHDYWFSTRLLRMIWTLK